MARVEALPYKVIRNDRVRAFWYEGSAGSDQELPTSLPGWDADTSIRVAVATDVDVRAGLQDADLEPSEELVAALVWSSVGTRMRGLGDRQVLRSTEDGPQSVTLTCEIPGKHMADSVDLTLLLALADRPPAPGALAPSRAGARLWSQTRSITLSGAGGRFPMQWVDFQQTALPENAAWYLDWVPMDLHRGIGNSLCLYLNSRSEKLRSALEASDPDDKAQLVFDLLRFDIGRSMLVGALLNDDLVEDREAFEDGSLGDTICRLIDVLFHDYDLAALVQKALRDRARFDALLQDRLRLAEAF